MSILQKCPHCNTPYYEGNSVDIGIGFIQVSEDEPNCDCEYIEWMEKYESKNIEY